MALDRYRQKRDFTRTPEPPGGEPAAETPADERSRAAHAPGVPARPAVPSAAGGCGRFVVHRHRAGRLHYDLRLEIDGVLASWALPRGPTRDPDERRFAARTEDHPVAYLDFEGVIPAGEYGAGDSICWDWGTFEPELTWDPGEALRSGELKLRLRGEKLAGRFTLVQTTTSERGRTGTRSPGTATDERTAWLLIAKRGPEATPGWDPEAYPASVKTGRTNADVAAGLPPLESRPAPAPLPSLDPPGARMASQPVFVEPMLATPGTAPFDGDDWLFEPKWDGYRIQASVTAGHVALRTRNGHDGARLFPELLGRPTWLAAPEAIVDGEVVALDSHGRPDFGLLQARLSAGFGPSAMPASQSEREAGRAAPLVFMAFDLPWCAGRSYLEVPLEDRTAILRLVLRDHPYVRFGGQVARDGIAFFAAAAEQGLEGAMAKHRRSRYEPGRRSTAWLKLKVRPTQELVVAGYVPGQGSHRDLGSLIVGVMVGGRLRYAGRVGSGLDAPTRARLRAALDARAVDAPPFDDAPDDLARTAGAVWATPELVIRAEIGGWSPDGIVRQASFTHEAPEVDPGSVERQDAVGPEAAARALAKAVAPPHRGAALPSRRGAVARSGPGMAPGGPTAGRAAELAALPPAPEIGPAAAQELAALDGMPARGGPWEIAGREVVLTNLDKVLAPALRPAPGAGGVPGADGDANTVGAPVTKRDLVRYLVLVAPVLLPHLAGRALNLARYPDGVDGAFFWQKDVAAGMPDWVTRWREPDPPDRRPHAYVVADSIATLAWLGNQAALEIHPWTSRIEAPDEPRWALVDIDPGERTTWDETLALARLFRRAFEHLGIVGIPKVTGKRGIQVFVPIRAGYTFVETRAWVEQVSRAVGAAVPDLVSWKWAKDQRGGRARLDYTQNWRNRTLVAPYSPRPAPGLPVSAPITWDELDDPELRPDRWTIRTILPRIAERGDLFAVAAGPGQELPKL
jgi:bifunctional non-homologous end joining protein LigD